MDFRRYYQSVRHYAVRQYSDKALEMKERRCKFLVLWQIFYKVYESIVMTQPPADTQRAVEQQNKATAEQVN